MEVEITTLQEYLEYIIEMLEENPKIAELPVVFSTDQDGSNYHKVWYSPSLGRCADFETHFLDITDTFNTETDILEDDKWNCVIIN